MTDVDLFAEGLKYTEHGYSVIPVNKAKEPTISDVISRRNILATDQELEQYFGNNKRPDTTGLAVVIDSGKIMIDADGEGWEIFIHEVLPKLHTPLSDKLLTTARTKSPHGRHLLLKCNLDGITTKIFSDGKNEKIYKFADGKSKHDEIRIRGYGFYSVERASGYSKEIDIEHSQEITPEELEFIASAVYTVKGERSAMRTTLGNITPHYVDGNIDEVNFSLSGFLHKGGVPEHLIVRTIEPVIPKNSNEPAKTLTTIADTCKKDAKSDQVSGYERLLAALGNDTKAVAEIEQVWRQLGYFNNGFSNIGEFSPNFSLPEHIQEKIGKNIFKIIGYNPLTLIVNDEEGKEIMKSIIAPPKSKFDSSGNDGSESERTTTTTTSGTGTTKTEVKTKSKLKYMPKNVIIDAAIAKLVINENPLDEGSKTYQITFVHRSGTKPFTVGPASVSQIIQELQNRGRYVRTKDAAEGLSAILAELEDRADQGTGMTTINRKIPYPGYFYLPDENKIIGNETTQRDINPTTEEGRQKILNCIEVLEGLYKKNKNKEAFATVIRFSTISPFGYAKKCMDETGSNWLPNLQNHGFSQVGKTTLSRISLAIWRKHGRKDEIIHSIGFTKADSEAKLGKAISKTTYHITINEVGSLGEKRFSSLVEMYKHTAESVNARGKHEQDGRFTHIPALSNSILSSNPPPPSDPAFKIRVIPLHFTKNHANTLKEKKAFEKWFYTEMRIDMLGVLGDFIAKYIILPNPEILKKHWLELSKHILTEFYKSVGKKPSKWFDTIASEDVIEQSIEETYFQLRGFFLTTIMDYYRKDFKVDPTVLPKTPGEKLTACLKERSIPFITYARNQKGLLEIIITHNIIPEMVKRNVENVTTLDQLATEIPGFKYDTKSVSGKTMRVVYGSDADFLRFINIKIEDVNMQKKIIEVEDGKLPGKGLDPHLGGLKFDDSIDEEED